MSAFVIHQGHALDVLKGMPDNSVDCCVTSPPYWGLRTYKTIHQVWGGLPDCPHEWGDEQIRGGPGGGGGNTSQMQGRTAFEDGVRKMQKISLGCWCQSCGAWRGELGSEPTPNLFVLHITDVFREVRRVVKGTLWLNIGDSWSSQPGQRKHGVERNDVSGWKQETNKGSTSQGSRVAENCKAKDLVGIPWMLAFALRADGWYLRQEIIWEKPACMPESVSDRPTRSHEQVFLLAKSAKYYYDADAIKEPASKDTHARYARGRSDSHKYSDGGPGGQTIARSLEHTRKPGVNPKAALNGDGSRQNASFSNAVKDVVEFRNKRSVWRIANEPNSEEHFAAFPIKLVEPCILAGSPWGGVVLDPFAGLGTVGNACLKHGRNFVGIELNPDYVRMAHERVARHYPLLVQSGQ